jgi:hypothetical protein
MYILFFQVKFLVGEAHIGGRGNVQTMHADSVIFLEELIEKLFDETKTVALFSGTVRIAFDAHFSLHRHERLRSLDREKSSIISFNITGNVPDTRKKDRKLLVTHSSDALDRSLLVMREGDADLESMCVEAFSILQVIMGEKPMDSLNEGLLRRSRAKQRRVMRSKKAVSEIGLILDLIHFGVQFPVVVDELYFHLCKQLNGNQDPDALVIGWLLFAVYIHAISPSAETLPHVKNFIVSSLQSTGSVTGKEAIQGHNTDTDSLLPRDIVTYCLTYLDAAWQYKERIPFLPWHSLNGDMVNYILQGNHVEVEVFLMNGSILRLDFKFGQMVCPFSIIDALYSRLYGHLYESHALLMEEALNQFERQLLSTSSETSKGEGTRKTRRELAAMAFFRGFQLCRIDFEDFLEGELFTDTSFLSRFMNGCMCRPKRIELQQTVATAGAVFLRLVGARSSMGRSDEELLPLLRDRGGH